MKTMTMRNGQHVVLLLCALLSAIPAAAQEVKSDLDKAPQAESKPARERTVGEKKPAPKSEKTAAAADARQALRREDPSEIEAAGLPYINNFFTSTRLGPEDIISVDVFEQPNYSRGNIKIPPSGRINYPHIGQIMVAGRTTDEIEAEINEKLSEYIRQPIVTVQVVEVHSLKYLVVGDVMKPGVYEMAKRMTVTEALANAGYITKYGDLRKVSVLRQQQAGRPRPIAINVRDVEKGEAEDMFLAPGDTIVVPGNKFKTVEKALGVMALAWWVPVFVRR
ncbi:MAG: polysaccharide biosynthesis/export family protein [Blastocatellia bacterium]|nr:polysaccharide biosynthesis/export family protein [Blastocatellia bacterium]